MTDEGTSVQILSHAAAVVHTLTGALWLGAMAYSFFLLQPRARVYFSDPAAFESFMATVSHGTRWKVLGALGLLAGSGGILMAERWREPRAVAWLVLIGLKTALVLAATALFVYVSWRLWPARVLAAAWEIPRIQRAFRWAAAVLLTLAASALVLGVLAGRLWPAR